MHELKLPDAFDLARLFLHQGCFCLAYSILPHCSICSLYVCYSILNKLIVCVLLNAQYAHTAPILNMLIFYCPNVQYTHYKDYVTALLLNMLIACMLLNAQYVTRHGKTGLMCTSTVFHFLSVRESYTHALPRNTKYLTIDGQVCFDKWLFTDAVKPQGCISRP